MKYISKEEQLAKARSLVEEARRAPYYSKKFAYAPQSEDIKTIDEWQKLPPLTRNDLYQNTYPNTTDMFTAPLADAIVLSTGGSSGIARNVVLTNDEWDAFCEKQAEAFKLLDVREDDIVANLFVAGHLWPSFIGVHEMVKRAHAVQLPISSNISSEEIYNICRKFQPTVMVSLPTLFVLLADMAHRDNYHFSNLRLIAYAGEQLSKEAEAHVRQWLGVKEIKALAYSSSDCGIMGYQCPHCGFGEYHLPSDFQMMEIVDPDTLQPVEEGKAGEVLVTNLRRHFQPIIRYRIGDMATAIPEACPCGDPNPRFRLAGRAGEDFKLGGAYISVDVFERAVSLHSADALSMNFQLTLEDIGNQMTINLDIESGDPASLSAKKAAANVRNHLISEINDIKVGLEINFISDFRVTPIPLGSLPRNPITGKIRKVVDKRVI